MQEEGKLTDGASPQLVVEIDLGDGNMDNLVVHIGNDPREVARKFCEKHSLDPAIAETLAEHIQTKLSEVEHKHLSSSRKHTPT